MAITATGELCYKKGGSALAYSKITNNNGAIIYKYGGTDILVIAIPYPFVIPDFVWINNGSSSVRVSISGYTQKITKLNNQHITLAETKYIISEYEAYAVQLDGITANDSVDISHTVSFSLNSEHEAGYMHHNQGVYWGMEANGKYSSPNKVISSSDIAYAEEIYISSSQSYVTFTVTYRITTGDVTNDNWLTIEKL